MIKISSICRPFWTTSWTFLMNSQFKRSFDSSISSPKNYYNVLGVKSSATSQEIKEAYILLSKKYHPDVAGDNPDLRSKFVEINEAFAILGKEHSRREYDFQRKINPFSDIESGYKMEYPKPEYLDPKLILAYEEEMRRRWNARLIDWTRGQGEYELERGHHVRAIPTTFSHSYASQEFLKYDVLLLGGLFMFALAMAYIYRDIKSASRGRS
uniref:Dnaj subfamily c n=1 Tax=Echinococcus granulosus TaxID=6210 RepID=A0A068WS76_ECHGR|nr:dnaj subfamily c [Echinococcus granulosus]